MKGVKMLATSRKSSKTAATKLSILAKNTV